MSSRLILYRSPRMLWIWWPSIRLLSLKAFVTGTYLLDFSHRVSELRNRFAQHIALASMSFDEWIARLTGTLNALTVDKDDAEKRWNFLSSLSPDKPGYALPCIAGIVVPPLVFIEAILLAPMMRGLGLAEEYERRGAAGAVIVALSVLLESSRHFLMQKPDEASEGQQTAKSGWRHKGLIASKLGVIGLTVLALPFLGLLRAHELIFNASRSGASDLARFLAENPNLTKTVMGLLTVLIPLAASFALIYSINGIRFASEWRITKWRVDRIGNQIEVLTPKINGATSSKENFLDILRGRCDEKVERAQHYYEWGAKLATRFPGFWRRVFKCLGIVVLVAVACFALDPLLKNVFSSVGLRVLLYCGTVLGVGLLYASNEFKEPSTTDPSIVVNQPKSQPSLTSQVVSEQVVVQVPVESQHPNGTNGDSRV